MQRWRRSVIGNVLVLVFRLLLSLGLPSFRAGSLVFLLEGCRLNVVKLASRRPSLGREPRKLPIIWAFLCTRTNAAIGGDSQGNLFVAITKAAGDRAPFSLVSRLTALVIWHFEGKFIEPV